MEINIEIDKTYEAYSKIPKNYIFLESGRKLDFKEYNLLPANRLDYIFGIVEIGYIKAKNYGFYNKMFPLGNRVIKIVIQKNNIIPLLTISDAKEKKISKVWPIIREVNNGQ